MSDSQYNLQFEKLCAKLRLGEMIGVPEAMSGGLLHRMYTVQTTSGKYAIKALNPQIMRRPEAISNYMNSERIAAIAARQLPVLPAKMFDETILQEVDNQFYLVFDWVEGRSLKSNEIQIQHCIQIGTTLADLHRTDFTQLGFIKKESVDALPINWKYYLQKGQADGAEWANLLADTIEKMYEWNSRANHSARLLASDSVISHRDLDSKNVMWSQDNPVLIDWEAAGSIHPMHELTETALYWSEDGMGNISNERFVAFIGAYKKRYGSLHADWGMVLDHGFLGKLGWLEYNLKRSLWIECADEKEQQLGTAQVTGTINALRRYARQISEIEEWLSAGV